MLIKLKTLRVAIRIFAPYFLKFLWFVSFVGIIVIFSKYTYDASVLREWHNDSNVHVSPNVNKSTYQNIIKYFNTKISGYNETDITINNSTSVVRKEVNRFESTIDNDEDVNDNDEDADDNDEDTSTDATELYNTVIQEIDSDTKVCKPEPPKIDFRICGNRIADRKCCEYIWALKYKKDLMERRECLTAGQGVVGGTKVLQGDFPHMAAVGFQHLKNRTLYSFKCGGSLISERFVLTAAHCTWVAQKSEYNNTPTMVRLGVSNIVKPEELVYTDKRVQEIIKHPKYNSPFVYYDIALLKLFEDVFFTYTIHPACLSTDLFTRITAANVTGWGITDYASSKRSDHLLVATLNIVEYEKCDNLLYKRNAYSKNFGYLRHNQICARFEFERRDTCKGDSGGPLQVRLNSVPYGNIHRVYGVTSTGIKCGTPGLPGIYVKVAAVISWIEKTVWPEYVVYLR